MQNHIFSLIEKKHTSLEERLSLAIKKDLIKSVFCFPAHKSCQESRDFYIKRVKQESLEDTFVRISDRGINKYVHFGVAGPIQTDVGVFQMVPAQVVGGDWGIHFIMVYPDLETLKNKKELFVRFDSGCFSGMVLGDKTCDCAAQLHLSKKQCVENKSGIIVEIPNHDGRGWGEYKMANQRLMHELNVDTVEAARMFYDVEEHIDTRHYGEAVLILRAMGFDNNLVYNLHTNNPHKIRAFEERGMMTKSSSIVPKNISRVAKINLISKSKQWNHKIN